MGPLSVLLAADALQAALVIAIEPLRAPVTDTVVPATGDAVGSGLPAGVATADGLDDDGVADLGDAEELAVELPHAARRITPGMIKNVIKSRGIRIILVTP
jgi:hypothetical protein